MSISDYYFPALKGNSFLFSIKFSLHKLNLKMKFASQFFESILKLDLH